MNPSIGNIISFSWKRMLALLFPFNFKRWLKILFIVWLAGQAGGGGFNFPNPGDMDAFKSLPGMNQQSDEENQNQPVASETDTPSDSESAPSNPADNSKIASPPARWRAGLPPVARNDDGTVPMGAAQTAVIARSPQDDEAISDSGAMIGWAVLALLLLGIPVMLLFMWLSSRFSFIFIESLVLPDMKIGESFSRHREIGNAYFRWSILFLLIIIGALAAAGLLTALSAAVKILIPLVVIVWIAFILGLILFSVILMDFIVPMMYRDRTAPWATVKKFFAAKPGVGNLFIYFLVRLGLAIAAGIAGGIVAVIALLILLIPLVILGLLGFFLASAVAALKTVMIILGVILLIPTSFAVIIALGLVTLPIPVFFRAFSVVYLTRLIPEYNLLNFPGTTSTGSIG